MAEMHTNATHHILGKLNLLTFSEFSGRNATKCNVAKMKIKSKKCIADFLHKLVTFSSYGNVSSICEVSENCHASSF